MTALRKSVACPARARSTLRGLIGWTLPVLLLVAMQWAAGRHDAPRYVVAPTTIAATIWHLLVSGELYVDTVASGIRSYSGFVLGATFGVFIGLLSAVWRKAEAFFDPLVSTLYPVPKIALLPVIITWLGFGDISKIAVIAVAVFFPTFINTLYGARATPVRLIWAARNMGAKRAYIFWHVVLPAALPQIFTGLRTGLALSFIVLFAAEMVGSHNGLGDLIMRSQDAMRYDWMYAAILAIGLLGFISDRILLAVRRKLLANKYSGEANRG
ncbi:MAG TPA: ABC transporter permease [Eoetvoesiella sp.]|uniref:ABC transporter permease n=1 Tax=Eoetvoesiella sp. TaxID=1966355 RepID=UPI002C1CCB31|nr:ABC transporter permease [Eoetvoesiella sp.]HWK62343.1 ABC transporter permease [Eoetvoesiella sp.]